MKVRVLSNLIWIKLVVIFTLATFVVAMLVPMAWAENEIIKVKYREFNEIKIEEHPSNFNEYAWKLGAFLGERYPAWEVIEIDGVPWQDSPYAQIIKENLTYYGENGSYFARHPELVEIALDKRFNGKGAEVWKLYSQGKTVDEIKQALLSNSENQQDDITPEDNIAWEELTPVKPGVITVVVFLNQKNYSVSLDGTWQEGQLDTAPTINNQRTLIPLRGVMEHFGAKVEWIPERKQIILQHENKEVVLTPGSTEALIDGQAVKLDVPAKVVNGRILIPLRFVSEQIGMDVKWDGKTQNITIGSREALTDGN
ncbi:MAG: hypothetical protein JL56_07290 [Desulfotomaculum sp. BICA1-6]|nr:MAG: hypothetical protein JL56_07290 [Desulfotomaculum sp. BICA1-6]